MLGEELDRFQFGGILRIDASQGDGPPQDRIQPMIIRRQTGVAVQPPHSAGPIVPVPPQSDSSAESPQSMSNSPVCVAVSFHPSRIHLN
jgi:hypothetical protein